MAILVDDALRPEPAELRARRGRIAQAIGDGAVAVIPSAPYPRRSERFRQSNEFFYVSGLEVPGSYVLIDGGDGAATAYLPRRDEQRERSEGRGLTAEDVDVVRGLSGVDHVRPVEDLPAELGRRLFRMRLVVHTPFAPAEGARQSRDTLLGGSAARLADPLWTSVARPLATVLREEFGVAECRDLTPVLDGLRLVKSAAEIAVLSEAARLTGTAVLEAMRSTAPGVREYELAAVAEFVFLQGGAAGGAYEAIVASGTNAWHGHYGEKSSALQDGELVLMDYAPDLGYYTSDIGRMWPVTGRWQDWQLELYEFVVRYHRSLLERLHPGVTADEVLDDAAGEMEEVVASTRWSAAEFERAAREALAFRGHLSHPVGMAVHDVGDYRRDPLREGLVFSVDPMLWVPERRLYVRCEDTVAITADGIENLTGFVPVDPGEIEAVIAQPGLLQLWRSR